MLFDRRFHEGMRDGSVTLTFRRWKRPQARDGGTYRFGASGDRIEVTRVATVRPGEITDEDARRAGFESREALLAYMSTGPSGAPGDDDEVYRIEFRYAGREAPTPELDEPPDGATLAKLLARLDRMDARSEHGPWTTATLRLIGEQPRTRAADLASQLGRERLPFKADVRKLKAMGLTRSHEVGYELTARGRAVLKATE